MRHDQRFLWGFSLVVTVVVGLGLALIPGPGMTRNIRMDQQREEDLRSLERLLEGRVLKNKELPEQLPTQEERDPVRSRHARDGRRKPAAAGRTPEMAPALATSRRRNLL